VFGAGCVYAGLQMTLQCFQITMAMTVAAEPHVAAVLGVLGYAVSVVAYAPFALMLTAVAILSFGEKPSRHGWESFRRLRRRSTF